MQIYFFLVSSRAALTGWMAGWRPTYRVVAFRNSCALFHESRGKTFIYCWYCIQCILWHLLAIKRVHERRLQLEFRDNLLQFVGTEQNNLQWIKFGRFFSYCLVLKYSKITTSLLFLVIRMRVILDFRKTQTRDMLYTRS